MLYLYKLPRPCTKIHNNSANTSTQWILAGYCGKHSSINAGLDPQFVSLAVRDQPGAGLSFVRAAVSDILLDSDRLILKIGNNDLNSVAFDPVHIVT